MLFPTVDFAVFFLAVLGLAWTTHRYLRLHKVLLLVASYFFYGYWDWRFMPLLAGVSLVSWVTARGLHPEVPLAVRRVRLGIGVSLCLGVLAFFKYLGFLASTLADVFHALGFRFLPQLPEIALPVGISFFVFQGISLMVDTSRGTPARAPGLLDSLLFIAFFPQLVAGPILRARDFLPQLQEPRDPGDIDVSRGLWLILLGLGKKVLVANSLGTGIVDRVFETPAGRSGLEVLLGVYGYAAQIYCDFSGYTDMAIGCALLMGYRFMQNFDSPYVATSPQDFWRRWHISLSSWLRDYLYVPLGGNRGGEGRTYRNLVLTMLLGGLWHGAAWTFVAWGALHGLGLVVHRLWSRWHPPWADRLRGSRAWPLVARVLLFHFVCLGWVFFRAPSFGIAASVIRSLANPWTLGPWFSLGLLAALALGIFGQALPPGWSNGLRCRISRMPLAFQGALAAAAVLVIDALGPSGIAPFIYFQF